MKLDLVSPCPQSTSIQFSIVFPLTSTLPAKCMHPQNDTICPLNQNLVEMKGHLEKEA